MGGFVNSEKNRTVIFRYVDPKWSGLEVEVRSVSESLNDLLSDFEAFLFAIGYRPKGNLQFVEDDYIEDIDDQISEEQQKEDVEYSYIKEGGKL